MNISVVMVTYDRRDLFPIMTDAILAQDYKDFEFLIINNGSRDGSEEIALQYAERDARIQYIPLDKSVSIGAARNVGVQRSKGDYIAFVDDDDHVTEDFLSGFVKHIKKQNADYVMCGSAEVENGIVRPQISFPGCYEITGEEATAELIKRKRIRAGLPGKIIRRELLERYPFREDVKHEDVHNAYKFLADAQIVVLDGTIQYYFHRHSSNLSGFTSHFNELSSAQLQEYIEAYEQRAAWLSKRFPNRKDYWNYSVWSFMLSMCEKVEEYQLTECRKEYDYMKIVLNDCRKDIINNQYLEELDRKRIDKLWGYWKKNI